MMKRRELDELKQKVKEDLLKEANTVRQDIVRMRLEKTQGNHQPRAARANRKKLAQLATLVRQKEQL